MRIKRKATIARLIGMANESALEIKNLTFFKPQDSLLNIIAVLGDIRATEAIPVLIKLKGKVAGDQVNNQFKRDPVSVFTYFFAAKALAKIGVPSVEFVLAEIKDSQEYSILNIQLNGVILREVYGKEVALFVLKEIDLTSLSDQSRKKLKIAQETIETYNPDLWVFNGQTLGIRQLGIVTFKQ